MSVVVGTAAEVRLRLVNKNPESSFFEGSGFLF